MRRRTLASSPGALVESIDRAREDSSAARGPDVHREGDHEPVVAVDVGEVHHREAPELAEVDGQVAEVGARRLEIPGG